ncbi:GNAT family N-acetyltransferase [Pelosinus sp. sgz500959]|uniref:GNAT family N-acetyltransferase n=1 Tax=Pelosinus sp. sgz500959 TaxID=3242472 RepID=UPI00367309F3
MQNFEIVLQSDRLLLRKITYADFNDLSRMLTDPTVMYAWEHTFSERQIKDWIERQLEYYRYDGVGYFAAISKESGDFVGQMGLHWSDMKGTCILEVCYMLKKEYWHKGFASEGSKALISYAFGEMHVDKVYACIRTNNFASLRVAENVEMKYESSFIKHYNGRDMEHLLYSKVRDDWDA